MLGTHLTAVLAGDDQFEVVAQSKERFATAVEVRDYLQTQRCRAIVNCIGYLGSDPEAHYVANACVPRVVADWAAEQRAFLLHVSTNAVFEPDESRLWLPSDRTAPATPYERAKAFGEDPRAYVLRASFIGFSPRRTSFLDRVSNGEAFADRRWNGVTADVLARRIAAIVRESEGEPESAVEHVHAPSPALLSDVARWIGSKAVVREYKKDARLLGGGVTTNDELETQVRAYVAAFGPRR